MGRIQQADLGSQSGENEKQGEEEYQCHVFDLFGHHPSETEIRRHDYTREKRTEQSMNTQNLRNIRRHDHDQKDEAHQCLADGLLTVVALPEPTHEGLYHEEHEEDITSRQQNGNQSAGHITCTRYGNYGSQQTPCRHVVVGRTGDGQHTHRRLSQIPFLYDTGQNREGGNTDRDGDKQRERHKCGVSPNSG